MFLSSVKVLPFYFLFDFHFPNILIDKQTFIMSQVKQNDTVRVHYTGKLTDGQIFDSSLEREPIEFTMGQGQLIPGFEKGLLDMKVNEKKTIEIPSEEAYGAPREELVQEVDKNQLPDEIKPEPGMGLVSKSPDGREMNLVVKEVKEDTIVVDGNHPLAGKDLIFDLEVVEIK
jgi:FKBP-type peptidyl-prolyl cis-trans isomerase SlpA